MVAHPDNNLYLDILFNILNYPFESSPIHRRYYKHLPSVIRKGRVKHSTNITEKVTNMNMQLQMSTIIRKPRTSQMLNITLPKSSDKGFVLSCKRISLSCIRAFQTQEKLIQNLKGHEIFFFDFTMLQLPDGKFTAIFDPSDMSKGAIKKVKSLRYRVAA